MRQGVAIANKGWKAAVESDPTLRPGVNVVDGRITYKAVADAHGLPYSPLA
jgi:alanine dehydrogenase